jgi:hypothetical protein
MSHRQSTLTIGLSLVAVTFTIAACRTTPNRSAGVCVGTEYLVVRNDSRETIDVLENIGSNYELIGTVGPGVSELQFPTGKARPARYVARRVGDGKWVASASGGTRGSVAFDVECNVARQ